MKRLCLVAAVVLGAATRSTGALAGPSTSPSSKALRTYVSKATVQIRTYQSLSRQVDDLFSSSPEEDVNAFVQGLRQIATGFDGLAARWRKITPPKVLRGSHGWMAKAFHLQSVGFSTWADAWERYGMDHDPVALATGTGEGKAHFAAAGAFQQTWAQTVRDAARRAHVPVPHWLAGMAKGG